MVLSFIQLLLVTLKDCDLPTLAIDGGGVEGSGGGGLSGGDCDPSIEFLAGVEKSLAGFSPQGLPDLNLLLYTGSSITRFTPVGDTGGEEKLPPAMGVEVNLVPALAGGLVGGELCSLSSRIRPVERSLALAAAIMELVISSLGGPGCLGDADVGGVHTCAGLGGGGGGGALELPRP